MIKKLRRKFVLAAMLSLFIVLAVLIFVINILNYRSLVREADDTLDTLSELDGNAPSHFTFGKKDGTEPPVGKTPGARHDYSGERPYQSRYFSVLLSDDGEVAEVDLRNVVTVDEETALSMAVDAANAGRRRGFSNDYRYLGVPTDDGMRWIFLNREVELDTARDFLLTSCLISLAGFVTVFLLLLLISGRVVQPIAQSYEKQKQFITDAGHELKTPITIIRADADVLEADVPDSEWLEDIRRQTDRLASLTNDLIFLSKTEETAKPQMLDFPLSEVVEESAQPFRSVARTQGKTFETEIAPLLTLKGDEKSIRKLVSILLDNAMKYSPEGGSIVLTLKKSGKQIRLSVTNSAENIEKGNADRLFDRFYRADSSRNSETGGFGLGLAIAKAVTEMHGGRIHAGSNDGASLTVEAVFSER